jgi:hypothetical protein
MELDDFDDAFEHDERLAGQTESARRRVPAAPKPSTRESDVSPASG